MANASLDSVGSRALVRQLADIPAHVERLWADTADLSISSSTPHLFGERLTEFAEELRRLLLATSPSGRFSVRLPDTELRIWSSG